MQAVIQRVYGGTEHLTLEARPDPAPAPRDVQVRVLACGINLSDWENLTGSPAYARLGGLRRPRHAILGSDIVGEITALGADVRGWQTGQRIWAEVVMRGGGFATMTTLPAARLAALPDALDPVTAAALPQPGTIALRGTAGIAGGDRVLINGGGGGSGVLAIELAKAAGADVTAVDTATKAAFMREQGADAALDFRKTDFTTTGERWDLILDLVGTRPVAQIARALSKKGRYRLVGGQVRAMLSTLFLGTARSLLTRQSFRILAAAGESATLETLGALAISGRLTPVVDDTIPLSAVPDGLARVGRGEVPGKIVVLPQT